MKPHQLLESTFAVLTGEQWAELFRRSKKWPRDRWSLLYPAYLRSRAWNSKRMARHEVDSFRCLGCDRGTKQGASLQCHHLTYERIGDENVHDDLITLCSDCHSVEHSGDVKPLYYHIELFMADLEAAVNKLLIAPTSPA